MSRDWRLFYFDLIGARNIFAHAYFGVDQDLVWHTVVNEIPNMLNALKVNQSKVMQ